MRPDLRRAASVLGCGAALAAAACAGVSSSSPAVPAGVARLAVSTSRGRIHYMPALGSRPALSPDAYVTYGGGPVLLKPKIYYVFWGYGANGDPNGVRPLVLQYARHVGGSPYDNIYTQYYAIAGGRKISIGNPARQFGGSWNDESAIPKTPSDAQVAAEAARAAKHFGFDPNGAYVVATARLHSASGFGTGWCAYHSATQSGRNVVPYVNFPYTPDAGSSCGANAVKPPPGESGADEGVTIVQGHEIGEIVTDPQPFSGWNGVQGEIGDLCAFHDLRNDRFGDRSYTSQSMFSDAGQRCVHRYP